MVDDPEYSDPMNSDDYVRSLNVVHIAMDASEITYGLGRSCAVAISSCPIIESMT